MKNFMWLLLGVLGGFVAAHFVNKSPRGRQFLGQVDATVTSFSDAFMNSFHDQDTTLRAP
jgi:hypothetical protein